MVDIVLELALVDDLVDFLTDTLNSAICSDLANDKLIELTLPKLECLIDLDFAVLQDFLKLEWAELSPLVLHSLERDAWGLVFLAD